MKKVLYALLAILGIAILTVGIFIYGRWHSNPEQVIPFPYRFTYTAAPIKLNAPVLITGDRMGEYFSKFQDQLSKSISQNISNQIQIQSLAKTHHGIHRSIHELKSLEQWPQIVIYQGGSEELWENKFNPKEKRRIRWNFHLYMDERFQTILQLYPIFSRVLYRPMEREKLDETPKQWEETETDIPKRLDTEFLLYEQHLNQLINMARSKNSLLILTTVPLNLDIPPKKVCSFSTTTDIEKEILIVEELMQKGDYKSSFKEISKLVNLFPGNAKIHFLKGSIANKLNLINEAKNSFRLASAYDCSFWRATEVTNSIIRRVAKEQQVLLFDFAKLVENDWNQNITFSDEIYPQNLYYERAVNQLGLVIKGILKL